MKIKLLSVGLFFSATITSFAQDARDILERSYKKCQSIQNGYFEMSEYMKFMSDPDTFINTYTGHFKKLKDNPLSVALFRYKHHNNNEYLEDLFFTGDAFVTTTPNDSTATIMSKALWVDKIKEITQNYTSKSPLTDVNSYPLIHDTDCVEGKHSFQFIGEEVLNNSPCYHVLMTTVPKNNNTEMKTIRTDYNYWIKKEDLIPIQYTIRYDMVMNNDTMNQFQKNVITKYEINNLKDESMFALQSIPTHYRMKDFVPFKNPDPLPKDTTAPNFKMLSLTGKEINLAALKGKLVLVDFFYKACYPCMQALPMLNELHEKYKGKGLYIIGIDPVDKKEDGMGPFLSKRGVTYPVLLNAQDIATDYRVSSCPTTYLIDKKGKIIYIEVGYGSDSKKKLEEIIQKNL